MTKYDSSFQKEPPDETKMTTQPSSNDPQDEDIKELERLRDLTPGKIVDILDAFIVGQKQAKRSVAVALRNRWRRQKVQSPMKDEILPKNILMIGPTGVGKTEIARRLAKISDAPFIKVEATKYTEVGYVGKDVESMIRDLVETSVSMVRLKEQEELLPKAHEQAEERILDLLLPQNSYASKPSGASFSASAKPFPFDLSFGTATRGDASSPLHNQSHEAENKEAPFASQAEELHRPKLEDTMQSAREKFRAMLRRGELNEREIQLDIKDKSQPFEILAVPGMEDIESNLRDFLGNMLPKKTKRRKMKVKEAFEVLKQEEAQKLVDMEKVIRRAVQKVEQSGIIFLDELDKVAEPRDGKFRGGVSREGVQRDLLPIVEGSRVNTKYGIIKTDHILFIGAGAFHQSKPSDLIPELQGRFPIRVELQSLTTEDFISILVEPKNSLIKQYALLMEVEGVELTFTPEAIKKISEIATDVNQNTENIGARRLHTIVERVLEDISFHASENKGKVNITPDYVVERMKSFIKNEDLTRYIL